MAVPRCRRTRSWSWSLVLSWPLSWSRAVGRVRFAGRTIREFEQPYLELRAAEKQRNDQAVAKWQEATRRHQSAVAKSERRPDGPLGLEAAGFGHAQQLAADVLTRKVDHGDVMPAAQDRGTEGQAFVHVCAGQDVSADSVRGCPRAGHESSCGHGHIADSVAAPNAV
jgi:hypothetical protein